MAPFSFGVILSNVADMKKTSLRALGLLAAALVLGGLSGAYFLFLWGFAPGSMPDQILKPDKFYDWTAARYRAAATADRVEVEGLAGEYGNGKRIICRATLTGDALAGVAARWRDLDFDIRRDAMCHDPVYRLRFYSGFLKKLDVTVCWKCSNLSPAALFPPVPKMGFDAETPEARRLYAQLQSRCPGTPLLEEKPSKPARQ